MMSYRFKQSQPEVEEVKPENRNSFVVKLKIEPLEEEFYNQNVDSASKQPTFLNGEAAHIPAAGATDDLSPERIDSEEASWPDVNPNTSEPELEGGKCSAKPRRKPGFCTVCEKSVLNINEHQRMHLDIRLQNCPYCEKSFVHRSNYYTHLNIHTRQRIYKCSLCSSEFNSPQGLNQHRARHLDTKHECLECGSTFVRKSYLRTHHQRVHQPRVRLTCLVCDKSFQSGAQVDKHMEIHSNGELNNCEVCQRVYKARKNLLRHMRTAHPECTDPPEPWC